MGLSSFQWSLGAIFGPIIGGLLANPTDKYPWLHEVVVGPFLERFPFLLPLAVPIILSTAVLAVTYVFLAEPSPSTAASQQPVKKAQKAQAEGTKPATVPSAPQVNPLRSLAVVTSVGLYALLSTCAGTFNTVFPLFLFTGTADGGFGFDSSQVCLLSRNHDPHSMLRRRCSRHVPERF